MVPRLLLLTFILFCVEMGVFLFLLPWTALWERNYFLYRYPELAPYLLDHTVRGAISGLGLVDIGLAGWYAGNFRSILARWRRESAAPALPETQESVSRGHTA